LTTKELEELRSFLGLNEVSDDTLSNFLKHLVSLKSVVISSEFDALMLGIIPTGDTIKINGREIDIKKYKFARCDVVIEKTRVVIDFLSEKGSEKIQVCVETGGKEFVLFYDKTLPIEPVEKFLSEFIYSYVRNKYIEPLRKVMKIYIENKISSETRNILQQLGDN